jgi:glycosyltransferase involved in cell wall biosynthesis
VISSNATSLPEVAGEAARYFDPTSVESIARALRTAHQQPAVLERCRQAAPAALARFDWTRAAQTYVACYRAAAGASLSPEEQALFDEAVTA